MAIDHVTLNTRVHGLLFLFLVFFKIDDCLCFSSDYDNYPNYRHESYGASNGSQGMRRHELPVDLPPSHESYPPSRRQHPSYSSGPSNPAPYYGIPPR